MGTDFEDPEVELRAPGPAGIRIPSTPGTGPPGVETFDLRTAADDAGKPPEFVELEKKVRELDAITKKLMNAPEVAANSDDKGDSKREATRTTRTATTRAARTAKTATMRTGTMMTN